MLASNYPFLDVFWTILIVFLWVAWFMLLFRVFADVFRRHDIGGGRKVLWLIFVIALPFLGVFVYLIAQGGEMGRRDVKEAGAARQQLDEYVRSVASNGGAADEISKAKQLLDDGAITQAEFETIKAGALA